MDFELWWETNKDFYTLLGVKKEYAKSIWQDAQLVIYSNKYLTSIGTVNH